MNDKISCDVVILPNPQLADTAIHMSQRLQQYDSFFSLKQGEVFPHVSLYMLQLNSVSLPLVLEILANIASTTTTPQLTAHRYNHIMGFIDAEYNKTLKLTGLQQNVIKALNPFRVGMQQKDIERMQEAEGLALDNLRYYGYKYVGDLFRPHMTLSRLKSDGHKALEVLGNLGDFNGEFLQLGLFEMGDNGTCVRKIKTFSFLP